MINNTSYNNALAHFLFFFRGGKGGRGAGPWALGAVSENHHAKADPSSKAESILLHVITICNNDDRNNDSDRDSLNGDEGDDGRC